MHNAALVLLGVIFYASAFAEPPPPLVETTLLAEGTLPWVSIDIGDQRGVHCIVDTGATMGVLPRSLTRAGVCVGSTRITTAIGMIDLPIMRIPQIQLGAVKLSGVDFLMSDKSWYDGSTQMPCVLGMNYLRHFTVDLDGRNQRMVLYERGTRIDEILGGATQGTHLDAHVQELNGIWTQVLVGAVPARAQIDTGWGLPTPNAALLARIGITKDDPRITEKRVTGKLSGKTSVTHTVELPQTRIGNLTVDKPTATLNETTLYWIEKNSQPYLHIGWAMFSEHRLLLDLAHADTALLP